MVKANTEQQTAAAESQNAAENISGAASAAGSLGWDWSKSSRIPPGPYLRNWHQNWAQPEHKTHRSCWELTPQCPSSVPITHETKRGVSKPQHRKECTPCLMARAEEQLLLLLPFSWISHCYCWMGGEKKEEAGKYFWGRKEVMWSQASILLLLTLEWLRAT